MVISWLIRHSDRCKKIFISFLSHLYYFTSSSRCIFSTTTLGGWVGSERVTGPKQPPPDSDQLIELVKIQI